MSEFGPLAIPILGEPVIHEGRPAGSAIRGWLEPLGGHRCRTAIIDGGSGEAWQLLGDEGVHVGGSAAAPSALAFWSAGLAAAVVGEVLHLARGAGVTVYAVHLSTTLAYSMAHEAGGSGLSSVAEPALFDLSIASGADDAATRRLAEAALSSMPASHLYEHKMRNAFAVTAAGSVPPQQLDEWPGSTPKPVRHPEIRVADQVSGELAPAVLVDAGGPPPSGHRPGVLAVAISVDTEWRMGGVVESEVRQVSPPSATWRIPTDLPAELGGSGRAPTPRIALAAGALMSFGSHVNGPIRRTGRTPDYRIYSEMDLQRGTQGAQTFRPLRVAVALDGEYGSAPTPTVIERAERTCFVQATYRESVDLRRTVE